MLADSSSERATCSTIWLGDHFPGTRGAVQAVAVRSPAAINWSIASLLAARAVLISAITFFLSQVMLVNSDAPNGFSSAVGP